ncbi:hypothetical protein MPLB_270080 [Mesorhizobium sp. ORS 3324]|nr:hypothetical protein MPLB_270080 [Mesorhizobium sp. ORS 3324]
MLQVLEKHGDPDRNRTCDLQIRNLPLYPTELRDHAARHITASGRLAKRRVIRNRRRAKHLVPFPPDVIPAKVGQGQRGFRRP